MREIKFRGKRKDNGEWVYGGFTQTPEATFVIDYSVIVQKAQGGYPTVYDVVEVIPKTVGQQTGLKDKSGTEIYCGDKLQDLIDDDIGTVYWKESAAGFYCLWGDGSDMSLNYGVATVKCEIIDNIHQNPKLLEQRNG